MFKAVVPKRPAEALGPESLGFRVWRGQPGVMKATHQHSDVEFNFVPRGWMRYFLAGRFREVAAGRLALLWGGMPHRLVARSPDVECFWVTLPLGWFLSWGLPEPFTRRLLEGELLVEPGRGEAARDLDLHARWAAGFGGGAPEVRRIVLLEVEARVRRLALALSNRRGPAVVPNARAGSAEKLAAFIGRHYREDLSVARIAAAVGLHPHYAMPLFKRSCGMGLWEYLTRLRVSHAQRLLLTGDAKVLEVALDSGFGSPGRFHAAFKRFTGRTPRDYRRAVTEC